jgi:DNA-binding MarR family transcriptional regulator
VQQTAPPSPEQPAEPEILPSDAETLRQLGAGIAATCAGFHLRRASRAVTQQFDRALATVGLRSTQFTLLSAMALAGPISTNELSDGLVIDRTTLTRNIRLLRDAGLVEGLPGRPGREIRFALTDDGRDVLGRAIPIWREIQQEVVASFGEQRWPGLVEELGRLVQGLRHLDEDCVDGPRRAGT